MKTEIKNLSTYLPNVNTVAWCKYFLTDDEMCVLFALELYDDNHVMIMCDTSWKVLYIIFSKLGGGEKYVMPVL